MVGLGDERRNARLLNVFERLMHSPQSSIQSASRGWDETMAAYRLLGNDAVKAEAILAGHREALLKRIESQPEEDDVLFIQDTTELNYSHRNSLSGTGPLSNGLTGNRHGFYLHSHYVSTEHSLPLGTHSVKTYARPEERAEPARLRAFEDKESYRWLEGYEKSNELAEAFPQRRIWALQDREADIYELFHCYSQRKSQGKPVAELIVRANRDRILFDSQTGERLEDRLYAQALNCTVLGTVEFDMDASQARRKKGFKTGTPRTKRRVKQVIRSCEVHLKAPHRVGAKLQDLSIWVVVAEEIDPPEGEEPIVWILNTSFAAKSFEQAQKIVKLYVQRWQIEVFFRILKSGCRIEELQLRSEHSLFNAIMLYLVIAWRIHYLTHLGRNVPDLPCSVFFEPAEWKATVAIALTIRKKRRSKKPRFDDTGEPTLKEMMDLVAELGGYLARKNDPPPGAQCLWQGLMQVRCYAQAWLAFGHEA